jgi:hypothetical protein
LSYALLGWWLVPLHSVSLSTCSCGRLDCVERGRHPRTEEGVSDASPDYATILRWWSLWPDANIGLALGPSDLLALALDEQNQGLERESPGRFPRTARILVPGGPTVLLYRRPPGMPVDACELATGLQLHAGCVTVLPPSRVDGPYCWARRSGPEVQVAPLPEWIVRRLVTRTTRRVGAL